MRKAVARIFAILAIAACAVAIYSVVNSNLLHKHHSTTTTTSSTPTSSTHTKHHHTPYTIKQGDDLTKIAAKHHVTVAQIKRLNPNIDAGKLHAGQQIQLR
jgi:peptidoglycan DL-endopeptidase LytE